MDIVKKTLVIILALGILGALFAIGIAFFAVALIIVPILYFYQRWKMRDVVAENKANKEKIIVPEDDVTIIDAEFTEVEDDKK